jgi:hypothetical protein
MEVPKHVHQNVVTLVQHIADQITAAGTDSAKLHTLSAALKTKAPALATQAVSHTPMPDSGSWSVVE